MGSAMIEATVIRGSSDAYGILEDDLHLSAHLVQLTSWRGEHVGPLEPHRSRRRGKQAEDDPTSGRLPTTRLPHEPEGLPPRHGEADPGDRLDRADRTPEQAAPYRELLHQVDDFEDRHRPTDASSPVEDLLGEVTRREMAGSEITELREPPRCSDRRAARRGTGGGTSTPKAGTRATAAAR